MLSPRLLVLPALLLGLCSCRRDSPAADPRPAAAAETVPAVMPEAFFQAALEGDLASLKKALADPTAARAAGPDGRTALMLAAYNNHTAAATLLLDSGAQIDARDQTGRTALMYACSGPSDATVAMLLKRGAGVNLVDSEEHWSPLMFAAAEGHGGVARILLAAGADPLAADIDGEDSELFARNRGFTELAGVIAAAKARSKGAR